MQPLHRLFVMEKGHSGLSTPLCLPELGDYPSVSTSTRMGGAISIAPTVTCRGRSSVDCLRHQTSA